MDALLRGVMSQVQPLRCAFDTASIIAMHEAWRRARPDAPHEPDVVAMLVLEGAPHLAQGLRMLLRPFGVRTAMASVFCHHRPTVEFGTAPYRCELGDLLLVHRHRHPDGVRSNALLLQAKMTDEQFPVLTGTDLVQLELYETWPSFTYYRTGNGLSGQGRDVRPKRPHPGAQYLLVDKSGPTTLSGGMYGLADTCAMAVWPAQPVLCTDNPWSSELIDFIVGRSGRPFDEVPGSDPTDWSKVVHDLLAYALAATFRRQRIKVRDASRYSGDGLASHLDAMCRFMDPSGAVLADDPAVPGFQAMAKDFMRDAPPPVDGARPDEPDGPAGISVVLIDTLAESR